MKLVLMKCRTTAPVDISRDGKGAAATGCPATLHPFTGWLRQVVACQLKRLLQFRVKALECHRQFDFDAGARL